MKQGDWFFAPWGAGQSRAHYVIDAVSCDDPIHPKSDFSFGSGGSPGAAK